MKHGEAIESIPGVEELSELALDMWWSWSHASDKLWGRIDPELWEITRNPQAVLHAASPAKLRQLLDDKSFREELVGLREKQKKESESAVWFQKIHPEAKLSSVEYLSIEFGL